MGNHKLKGKDLCKINYASNQIISQALEVINRNYKHDSKEKHIQLLLDVKNNYAQYLNHELWYRIAKAFEPEIKQEPKKQLELQDTVPDFQVFGKKHISQNAFEQMELAMRLPITLKGALMPDAHHGYGLPIGGVLATKNAVIPYGVGVDIGCRMALTIFDAKESYIDRYSFQLKTALKNNTSFGTGGETGLTQEHEILDSDEFTKTALLRQLHGKAVKQLGSSGSGNHFVEFGIAEIKPNNDLGLEPGNYVALLSHSGSRGFGATIANHYTALAKQECLLPRQAQHLAWLDLNSEFGQEYWLSMNLAGDYAKACHDQIHYHLTKDLGLKPLAKVENHHNFAWKQIDEHGEEIIVHRKGATPAAKGEKGIIPGSMTRAGYIVSGKGHQGALLSASHGAGRKMSRKAAKESITGSEMKKVLKREKVTLIGGGIDEAPMAYKDIDEVILSQTELVDVIGKFYPKIVRMDKN